MEREKAFMSPEDFFESDGVIWIESLQGGHVFINTLLKLHAKFHGNGGRIAETDVEASAEQTLSLIAKTARTSLLSARRIVEVCLDRGFMEEKDGFLYLTEIPLCAGGRKGGAGGGE